MATSSALLARALDPAFEPPADETSERILDAALAVAASSGVRHLTMDDVAARARVGRMTVYRRFGTKDQLVEALTVREGRRCLAELDAAMAPDAPIADQVAEGFVTSLRLAREHPLLARLARTEPDSMLEGLRADGGGMFTLARAFVAERLRASQRAGVLGPVPVDESAELLVRLAISFVLLDDTDFPVDDETRLRALARSLVAPIVAAPRRPSRR